MASQSRQSSQPLHGRACVGGAAEPAAFRGSRCRIVMTVKGVPLAMVAAGGILAWSGLFNKTVTQTIQDLVRGEKPVPGPPGGTPLVSGSGGTGGEVGTGTGNPQGQVIAADALGYQGAGYEWDGSDHDTGMTIPG